MVDKIAWPHVRLGNLITLKNGDYLPVELTCVDGTVPVYGGGDIKGYTSNSNCEPDTVIISRQGATCGTVRQVSSPFWATEHAMIVGIKYDGLLPRWGFYAMSNLNLGRLSMAAAQPGISQEKVKSQRIYLPPVDEQRRIADFLDEKCAQIDRAITSAEQSIQEYRAYSNSVVFQAVTKGLDPGTQMKDSGVEWLGEVPAGWGLRQAGQLADQTKTPNEGMTETNLLSLSYGKVKRRDINATDGLLPASFETYNIIEPDDIVLRFTDLQNDQKSLRVGRATERGIITSAYVTVRPFDPSCSRYMYYALHAYDLRKGFYGMGAGVRQGLKWQEAKYIVLPWPGEDDRARIAGFLDEKCAQIDRAVEAKQAVIDELKSYKKSLIYEVVTGKREV